MCDYSLHYFRTRLAEEGETLIVHRFPSATLGLASPVDLRSAAEARASQLRAGLWSAIKGFLSLPDWEAIPAVCIPPGAQLSLQDIPACFQRKFKVSPEEDVIFTQLSAEANTYRDAVRFSNGLEVLLQKLKEGQRAIVLSLSVPDELPQDGENVRKLH
jgi:hypothetical protein